ncbi:MAG TPA: hypothetical protein ENJ30_11355 [Desulfobulbaceae bacterium]|nr:hypothetical protein [Desulfobulbaceae bacterium]
MGFDTNGVKFLLTARASGVRFERSAMIGRQRMHLFADTLDVLLKHFGFEDSKDQAQKVLSEDNRFAEPFLRLLGATEIASFDASDYESATCIHDMNEAIPEHYKGKYSVVIDGGTLEHVFNFPVALKNCMEMIEVGGYYLGMTPANNFMGHGFYQFSPELYFRAFSPSNGFITEQIFIHEDTPDAQWVKLPDPEVLGKRVQMVNSKPAYLLVQARKTSEVNIFEKVPQQSDYSATWKNVKS